MTSAFPSTVSRAGSVSWLRRLPVELRRWGLPGLLAAVLAGASLLLVVLRLPQARAAHDEVRQAVDRAQAAARTAAASPPRRSAASTDPARRFMESLPSLGMRHQRVARLLELASEAGLVSNRSELRLDPPGATGLQRLRVTVPVQGGYLAVRRFVAEALREEPAWSLDRLRLERSDGPVDHLQAELQWSLWLRPDRAVSSGPGTP